MSKMIQAATGSVWSHVGVLLRVDSIDRILVAESVESVGVRPCSLSRYVYDYNSTGTGYPGRLYVARHQRVSLVDQSIFCTFSRQAVDLFGCLYDTKHLAQIALRIVADKLGLPPQKRVDNTSFICSEFASICLGSIGVEVPYNHANYIAPADFARCDAVTFLCEIAVQS
jgi:hypothetical protein